MRLQLSRISNLNQYTATLSPKNATGTQNSTLLNLLRHSDYYYTASDQTAADFQPVHGEGTSTTSEGKYSQALDPAYGSHAALTFMDILVNGDLSWTGSADGPIAPSDRPRFVDVVIGLIDSVNLKQAIDLEDAGNSTRAQELIEQHERTFTRRIFMRNTGVGQ
jgi:hypothetical protein